MATLPQWECNKKMRVKINVKYLFYINNAEKNVKYLFYKNNAEKNEMFHIQIMLKGCNKHVRIICDTCSKLSIRA